MPDLESEKNTLRVDCGAGSRTKVVGTKGVNAQYFTLTSLQVIEGITTPTRWKFRQNWKDLRIRMQRTSAGDQVYKMNGTDFHQEVCPWRKQAERALAIHGCKSKGNHVFLCLVLLQIGLSELT